MEPAAASPGDPQQILTVAQMVAAEQALIDGGTSVEDLMRIAGRGAGEHVWRISGGRPVTVLCGPGNNGGDGYVVAELIRERGGDVAVIATREPGTAAARDARAQYQGPVSAPGAERRGEVFVDCLFGSGLNRALPEAFVAELNRLARAHVHTVAVDLPSGIESDSGALLNPDLPASDLTIALGAWKFAHWTMPAAAMMGARRLVDIGAVAVPGAARLLERPRLAAPAPDAHKYTRGLLGVVVGPMPGAALLACAAAQRSGAGYVRLLAGDVEGQGPAVPPDLVLDRRPLDQAVADRRMAALLVGPGLGREDASTVALLTALAHDLPTVIDADGLVLLTPRLLEERRSAAILTPHEGELAALERAFDLPGEGLRRDRAQALAGASGAVVLLKGPDSLIATPEGALVCAPQAPSWLAIAGTGDVLAGIIASRLATGTDAASAAAQGLWLHAEAARRAGPALTPGDLAGHVSQALATGLG